MYVILGATGNIGSVITSSLLAKGEKVRAVGRDAQRLQRFAHKGAEAFVANVDDATALSKAFSGARAAFLMIPPGMTSPNYRVDQDRESESIATAAERAGLSYAVVLSSYAAQQSSGTGPIAGLHGFEQRLNQLPKLNALFLRPSYFMENHLYSLDLIRNLNIFGTAVRPDVKIPMIATRDIGAFAAERLLTLDFSGKSTHELLGQRDLTMTEVANVIGPAIGKPGLPYVQFPYDQVAQALRQMGVSPETGAQFMEMYKGINEGNVKSEEPRSPRNTTATSIETFAQEVFVPAFKGAAASA